MSVKGAERKVGIIEYASKYCIQIPLVLLTEHRWSKARYKCHLRVAAACQFQGRHQFVQTGTKCHHWYTKKRFAQLANHTDGRHNGHNLFVQHLNDHNGANERSKHCEQLTTSKKANNNMETEMKNVRQKNVYSSAIEIICLFYTDKKINCIPYGMAVVLMWTWWTLWSPPSPISNEFQSIDKYCQRCNLKAHRK